MPAELKPESVESVTYPILAEFGGRCRKVMLGVWGAPLVTYLILAEFGGRCRKVMLGVWGAPSVT